MKVSYSNCKPAFPNSYQAAFLLLDFFHRNERPLSDSITYPQFSSAIDTNRLHLLHFVNDDYHALAHFYFRRCCGSH